METTEKIQLWNNLPDQEKAAFGDMYITHESNLRAWVKDFDLLSQLKKDRVIQSIEGFSKIKDHQFRGMGTSIK